MFQNAIIVFAVTNKSSKLKFSSSRIAETTFSLFLLCIVYPGLWECGARSLGRCVRLLVCSPLRCLCPSSCPTSTTSTIARPTRRRCRARTSTTSPAAPTCRAPWENPTSVSPPMRTSWSLNMTSLYSPPLFTTTISVLFFNSAPACYYLFYHNSVFKANYHLNFGLLLNFVMWFFPIAGGKEDEKDDVYSVH